MTADSVVLPHPSVASKVLRVAWLAVLLGLLIQALVLLARLVAGGSVSGLASIAEVTQSITWSLIVCAGVALGIAAQGARVVLGGLLGLISGPVGWGLAKGAQRLVQAMLDLPVDRITDFFLLLCVIKGVEYFVLGALVAALTERSSASMVHYAGVGAAVGAVGSTLGVMLTLAHNNAIGQPMLFPKLVGLAASEFSFPIGCALVIYAPFHLRRYAGLS